jgi:hypothetical protein
MTRTLLISTYPSTIESMDRWPRPRARHAPHHGPRAHARAETHGIGGGCTGSHAIQNAEPGGAAVWSNSCPKREPCTNSRVGKQEAAARPTRSRKIQRGTSPDPTLRASERSRRRGVPAAPVDARANAFAAVASTQRLSDNLIKLPHLYLITKHIPSSLLDSDHSSLDGRTPTRAPVELTERPSINLRNYTSLSQANNTPRIVEPYTSSDPRPPFFSHRMRELALADRSAVPSAPS